MHRETIGIWISRIQKNPEGLKGSLDQYINAKKGSRKKRKLDGLLKVRVYRIQEENKNYCGLKIKKYLTDESGSSPGATMIYKVLKEKYQLRSKWKKNQK